MVATLPWQQVPIHIQPGTSVRLQAVTGLDPRLMAVLRSGSGFQELLPVQAVAWTQLAAGLSYAHDLCIAAPTGSGKTLAYALPVINGLASRPENSLGCAATSSCLQALMVLPTRDLAAQVYRVVKPLCDAVGLTCGLAAAQASTTAEEAQLLGRVLMTPQLEAQLLPHEAGVAGEYGVTLVSGGERGSASLPSRNNGSGRTHRRAAWPAAQEASKMLPSAYTPQVQHSLQAEESVHAFNSITEVELERSCVQVLVATPGRLVSHMLGTPGFTLRHLRFLVVDETDRLLRQSYQDWLPLVVGALSSDEGITQRQGQLQGSGWELQAASQEQEHQHLPGDLNTLSTIATHAALPFERPRCIKLVVSATLTQDPSKLSRLHLHCPRFVSTVSSSDGGQRYQLPTSLQQYKILCSAERKPLMLLALLQELRGQSTVIFASSVETTHRLFLMLQAALEGDASKEVAEFSGTLTPVQRSATIARFMAGRIKVLVASDAMTRGMDVVGVQNVINYDAPVYAKTYVHRAGRTARAGRAGCVITLLRSQDVRHFSAMLNKAKSNTRVSTFKLPAGVADKLQPHLDRALSQVAALLTAEAEDDRARSATGKAPQREKGKAAAHARGSGIGPVQQAGVQNSTLQSP